MGICSVLLRSKTNADYQIEFVVIKENFDPLLSGAACKKLELIKKIKSNNVMLPMNKDDFVKMYSERFNGLGKLPGQFIIKLRENFVGVIFNQKGEYRMG